MAGVDPVGASAALFQALKAEAAVLKRKQQRKGIEYRVKEGSIRPNITRGTSTASGDGSMLLSSPKAARPITAPSAGGLGKTGGSTDSGGASGAGGSGDGLDDYDPIAAQEKEHHDMMADLGKCREEASNLHHRVMTLLARREDLEHEGEKLAYMDGIEAERDEGLRAIETTKLKVTALETALAEEDTYRATLDFMYVRAREQKVTTLSVQKAFEDSLAAHHKEFDLKQGLLTRVQRAGEEEAEALRTTQAEIRKEIGELDRKLAGRQQELWIRQEKARLRASKLEHDFALEAAAGALSPEEERLIGEKLKTLTAQAAEVRTAKARAQADADSAELEFNRIRFAAGIQTAIAGSGGAGGAAARSLRASGGIGTAGAALVDSSGSLAGGDHGASLAGTGSLAMSAAAATTGSSAIVRGVSKRGGGGLGGGALGDGDDDLFDLSASGPEPEPLTVINRFATLELELKQIEDQVADYTTRLKALRHRHAFLESAKQPMARDSADEVDNDVSRIDKLTARHDAAKRGVEVAKAERREAESVKMQLQQSIRVLTQRLDAIPPLPPSMTDRPSEDEKAVAAALDAESGKLESAWAVEQHAAMRALAHRMFALLKIIDEPAALAAYHDAAAWLQMAMLPLSDRRAMSPVGDGSGRHYGGYGARPGSSDAFAADPGSSSGGSGAFLPSASATGTSGGRGNIALLGGDEDINATIERLVSNNEWSIRVKPALDGLLASDADSVSGPVAPTNTAKVLADAAHMFERQLREGVSLALRGTGSSSGGGGAAAASSSGGGMRGTPRKHSFRGDGGADEEGHTVHSDHSGTDHLGAGGGGTGTGGWGRRASVVGQATAALKPKPRELQKMLAAALQMSGTDVDEHLVTSARREPEEVVTRDALKRATKTQLRQMLRAKRAQASKEEAAAKGGAGTA